MPNQPDLFDPIPDPDACQCALIISSDTDENPIKWESSTCPACVS